MDKLPLNALQVLAVVRAEGGVRAAARALDVSHSAVSRHLAELERWLGLPIVERGGARGVVLTRHGIRLAESAESALQRLRDAVDQLREPRSPWHVTVSTTPSIATRWLLPRLPALGRAHPKIDLSVVVEQRVVDPGEIGADFAIRMGAGPWPGVDASPLMSDALYPVVSPMLRKASGGAGDLRQLIDCTLLHDRDPQATWSAWRQAHGPAQLDVRSGPRFTSSDLVLRAAAEGLGVALARHRLAAADLASGRLLRPFGPLKIDLGTSYWIVTPTAETLGRAANMVISWLRREAAADDRASS